MSDEKEKREEKEAELASRYEKIKQMTETDGWKIVKEMIEDRMETIKDGLLADEIPAEEIYKLRAYYHAFEEILDYVYNENLELIKEQLKGNNK